jgi:polyphenol oxidase
MPFLESRLVSREGVIAGFSTRRSGDDAGALAHSAGFSASHLYTVTQVHGDRIITVTGEEDRRDLAREQADGMITVSKEVVLAVKTADCVPLLLTADDGSVVAAVHAGWRGFVAGIVERAVAELEERWGARRATIRAAIGPAIDRCCFEVGEEVAREIGRAAPGPEVVLRGAGRLKPHVDLRQAVQARLLESGLEREHIERVGACTRCASSLFHSYRRDGAGKGRQLSFVFRR